MSEDAARRLLRQTTVYMSGQVVRAMAAAAQIPLFAAALPPAELGRFVTVQAVALLMRLAGQVNLTGGLFRVLAEHHATDDARAARRDVTSTFVATLLLSTVVAVAIAVGARVLEQWWLAPRWVPLADIAAITLVLSLPRDLADIVLRATHRAGAAAALASVTALLTLGGWMTALLVLDGGALEMLRASAAVSALVAIPSLAVLAPYLGADACSREALRRIAKIALPTIPAVSIDWAQQYADRFFIGAFVGVEAVGVYGLAHRVASSLRDVAFTGLQSAWDPFTYTEHRRPDAARLYGRVTGYFAIAGMAAVVATAAGIGPLLAILDADGVYAGAAPLVFFLATAYWLSMLRHMFLAPTAVRERTDRALPVWAASGVSAVAFSLLLIPAFEADGAAWAKVATYAVGALVAIPVGRRLWRIEYDWRVFIAVVVAGVAAYAVVDTLSAGPAIIALIWQPLAGLAVLVAVLLISRTITTADVRSVMRTARPRGVRR
ncbi:MAG: hypothetical protein AMXMBFR23_04810 [Chloroflexota bacterium]